MVRAKFAKRVCETCGRTYKNQRSMREHQRKYCHGAYGGNIREHALDESVEWICTCCGKMFNTPAQLLAHQGKTKHGFFMKRDREAIGILPGPHPEKERSGEGEAEPRLKKQAKIVSES